MICAACGILIAVIIGVIVFFAVQKDDPKELPKTGDDSGEPWFVNRSIWNAEPFTNVHYVDSQEFVVIAHTASGFCRFFEYCSDEVHNMQLTHMRSEDKLWDIAYNFLVGGDGRVYEGRGWKVRGAHSAAVNSRALGVAFIGDYRSNNQNSKLTPRQITNVQRLLREGVVNGGLRENYALVAHCQVSNVKESPGDNVYNVIKEWDHYSNYTLNEYFCSWKEANITDSGSHTVLPATLGKLLVSSSLLTALLTPGMR